MKKILHIFIFLLIASCSCDSNEDYIQDKKEEILPLPDTLVSEEQHIEDTLTTKEIHVIDSISYAKEWKEFCVEDSLPTHKKIHLTNYSSKLKKWMDKNNEDSNSLKDFILIKNIELTDDWHKMDTFDLSKDEYAKYYKFTPDSSKIIDLVSLGGAFDESPDSQVLIKDINNKKLKVVLSLGASDCIDDGIWINNNQCMIVGKTISGNYQKQRLVIYFIDLEKKYIQLLMSNKDNKLSNDLQL
jgi:hypothetical protein